LPKFPLFFLQLKSTTLTGLGLKTMRSSLMTWAMTSMKLTIVNIGKDNKADVILKYNTDESRSLKAYGELPEHAKINDIDGTGPEDDEIQFDDMGDDVDEVDDVKTLFNTKPQSELLMFFKYRFYNNENSLKCI
uniref:S1-like domain-containing protein n=1 Tax=Periophthalmus magnuspinnatus TaxID=409849 RepID=A0A3B3ZZV1_9GOBI